MAKETKIAKENAERFNEMKDEFRKSNSLKTQYFYLRQKRHKDKWKIHKQTCQRWLEFLEDKFCNHMGKIQLTPEGVCRRCMKIIAPKEFSLKILDLKQAIKIYEDNGI